MAEFLSMTLLSAEPVSAAKPQAMQSNDGATEPDQSFAATLAAEVNGKAAEKPAKVPAKTRQNNASDLAEGKDVTAAEGVNVSDVKTDNSKPVTTKESSQGDAEELVSDGSDNVLVQNDKGEAEQSHWLNLLEKAKSLQERLSKTETEGKTASNKTAIVDDAAAQAITAKQQSDKTKAIDLSAAEAKAKTEGQNSGAIELDEKLIAEQSSEQHLTAEELKALKLITQSDKNGTAKTQAADTVLKQKTAAEVELVLADSKDKAVDKSLSGNLKDTISAENKPIASIEKSLKTLQTTQSAEVEKQAAVEAEVVVTSTTVSKTQIQSEQATALLKGNSAATTSTEKVVETDDNTDSEPLISHSVATDVKAPVQAQSAAALMAPAAQQHTKAAASEAKVTTEEALKQIQTAAIATQGEQGASSSSGESSQQGSADAILTVIEQQKGSAPVVAEVNSFSNQLKSSLEKTNVGISVATRETVSETGQKQMDQLGQKLNLIQPEASNQLKDKMLMMVKDKVHTAEIRLDPSELGSMQIKISLQQDQMSVQFMVQQGNAKELMEQQMPKLKELLQQQGIELSQGSVQQQNQSSSGQEGGRRTAGGNGVGTTLDSSDELVEPGILPTKNSDRVVDYYA
ncbi:flagellar hook-length control protein FliK [Rheinheimera faecalis]|uniref:flagellar hook-length control protein FliK n=1 Tax=Rheinheimera faecalis TaxID=2901141 RepID=UPI001E317AC8|nr:flagellar hook-length control protein FliK [Rheinheimera faecalis]